MENVKKKKQFLILMIKLFKFLELLFLAMIKILEIFNIAISLIIIFS